MTLNSQQEERVRAAFDALSDATPVGAEFEELPDADSRGALNGRWRKSLVAVAAAVAVVAAVGIFTQLEDREDPVVLAAPEEIAAIVAASWTPVPSPVSGDLTEAAVELCDPTRHPNYEGELPLVVLDQRGDAAVAHFYAEDENGGYGITCSLVRVDGRWMTDANAEEAFGSILAGSMSPGAVEVRLELPDGSVIEGSADGGTYLFWFPGETPWEATMVSLDADGDIVSRDALLSPGEQPPPPPPPTS